MHFVQSCVGSLLYYARAVDSTMLPAINEISGSQASPTQKRMNACTMLLDYAASYPLAIIRARYHASIGTPAQACRIPSRLVGLTCRTNLSRCMSQSDSYLSQRVNATHSSNI
jgi:hypothetical protein